MKSSIILLLVVAAVLTEGRSVRNKRDLTCAIGGDSVCDVSCKGRGYKDGKCAWVVDSGEFSCECSEDRRGIRCNLGGENVCHLGCMATGHRTGICIDGDKCQCSDEMTSWGDLIRDIKSRL